MIRSTSFALLATIFLGLAKADLNAYEEPDTLFLLTFQTPVMTFSPGDTVDSWGSSGVPGTYFSPTNSMANITAEPHSSNPFCLVGLPLGSGAGFNFKPTKSEWGSTGNFTLELWASIRTNIGYPYYEQMVFGFPKFGTSTRTVSVLHRYASTNLFNVNYTVPAAETIQYAAISFNGTHFNVYQNGTQVLALANQKALVTDITSPLVTIGGRTISGLSSQFFAGTIYMIRFSNTAKRPSYFANNWKAYIDESAATMTFNNRTYAECAKLCMDGEYGFGGRKKCRGYWYKTEVKTCILNSFTCDMSGVIPQAV